MTMTFTRRSILRGTSALIVTFVVSSPALAAGAIVWGWLIAQSPRLIGTRVTIHAAAATPPALTALAIAGVAVLIAVLPAFYLLYVLFAHPSPEVTE